MVFSVDKSSTVSIYQQLVDQIVHKVQTGELFAGKKIPTVREMADQIGVARGTVKHAYEELERIGIIKIGRASCRERVCQYV